VYEGLDLKAVDKPRRKHISVQLTPHTLAPSAARDVNLEIVI
jgi:hypothetical protein